MRKKVIVSIAIIVVLLIISTIDVFGIRAPSLDIKEIIYNEISYIISIVMKIVAFLLMISYIVFAIVYMNKSKKTKSEIIKKIIMLLIVTIIVSLGLFFGSEKVKLIGAGTRVVYSPLRFK